MPRLKPKKLLVKEGRYVAAIHSVDDTPYAGERAQVVLEFALFATFEELGLGVNPVGRVPGYFNVDGVGDGSKYARLLLACFGSTNPDGRRLSDFRGKLVEVEVVTVKTDAKKRPRPEELWYSRVTEVFKAGSSL